MEEVGPNARLVFINGQAVILTGDGDLSNISPDQQALQEASEAVVARSEEDVVETITPSDVSEQTEETEPAPAETQQTTQYAQVSPGNVASFVAIIHGEHGDSQTIPLTQEQVAALGLQLNGGEAHVEATLHMEEAPAEGDETMMETESAPEPEPDPEPEVGMVQVPDHQEASEAVVARSEEDVVETITPSDVSEQTEETEPAPAAETSQITQYAEVWPENVASFVATLHGEHGDSQTIHLTQDQVAALGLQLNGGEAHVEATLHMEEAAAEGETMMETESAPAPEPEPEPEVGMVQVPEQRPPQPQPQPVNMRSLLKPKPQNMRSLLKPKPQNMRSLLKPKPRNGTVVIPVTEGQQGLMVRTVQLPQTTTANTTRTTITQVAPARAAHPPRVSLAVTPAPTIPKPPQKIPVWNFNSDKHLGSIENPIQLIQRGNTFHSTQPLSTEQRHQIVTILRARQMSSQSQSAAGFSNVIYDTETNTRITYKVVYPEDLNLLNKADVTTTISPQSGTKRKRGHPPKSVSTADERESTMTMTIEDEVVASTLGLEVGSHTVSVPKAVMNPKDEPQEPVQQVQYTAGASDKEIVDALAMLLDSGNPTHYDLPEEGEEPANNPADQHTQEPEGSRNDDGTQMTLDPETGFFVPVATEPQGHESAGDQQQVAVITPAAIDFDALVQ